MVIATSAPKSILQSESHPIPQKGFFLNIQNSKVWRKTTYQTYLVGTTGHPSSVLEEKKGFMLCPQLPSGIKASPTSVDKGRAFKFKKDSN